MSTTTVIFETHSTTEDNEASIATGWLPGRLSETGRANAAALGARRRNDGLSVVFVSDLQRAVETVELALGDRGLPVLKDWRLRECDYGELNGAPMLAATLFGDEPAALCGDGTAALAEHGLAGLN